MCVAAIVRVVYQPTCAVYGRIKELDGMNPTAEHSGVVPSVLQFTKISVGPDTLIDAKPSYPAEVKLPMADMVGACEILAQRYIHGSI